MFLEYLNKHYVQSLIIGVISSIVYKLINRSEDNKHKIGFVTLLKVFFTSTVSALFVLYTVNFKLPLKQIGGSSCNVETPLQVQEIMTGKPTF